MYLVDDVMCNVCQSKARENDNEFMPRFKIPSSVIIIIRQA